METKKRYTDEELEEFRTIVNDKLAIAKSDYDETMKILMNKNTNDVMTHHQPIKRWKKAVQTKLRKNWYKWHNVSRSLSKPSRLHLSESTIRLTALIVSLESLFQRKDCA